MKTCPPCNYDCHQGRICPGRLVSDTEADITGETQFDLIDKFANQALKLFAVVFVLVLALPALHLFLTTVFPRV